MHRRILGRTDLDVSRLSLGCATFGREIDQAASFAVLDRAAELGINLIDTAAAYGGGRSEEVVGRWLRDRGRRHEFILQTKVTPPLDRRRILESLDGSLRRLGVGAVDVFMLHAFDPATPLEESLAALDDATRAGKARYAGCSNFTADQLVAALRLADVSVDGGAGAARLAVTQFNYNLAVRDAEPALLPACRRHDVGVQTYSPLGAGFLTGKYDPATRHAPPGSRFDLVPGHKDVYFHEEKFRAVERLGELSRRLGIPAARLAVAWALANNDVDTVLVGARTPAHLDNAVAASALNFDPAWAEELAGRGRAVYQWSAT